MRHVSRAARSASMTSRSIRRLLVAIAVFASAGLAIEPGLSVAGEWSIVPTSQASTTLEDVWCEWHDYPSPYYGELCMAVGRAVDHQGIGRGQVLTSEYGSFGPESMPDLAYPSVSHLTGVSCRDYSCMIVGNYGESGTDGPFALRRDWDGSTWFFEDPPWHPDAANAELSDVTCSKWFECMAVGSYVDSWDTRWAYAARWSGYPSEEWFVEWLPVPEGATSSELSGVSCPDTGDLYWWRCTAAGSYVDSSGVRRPLVLDWFNGTWAVASTPTPSGASSAELSDVSCFSPDACTAVGSYRDATDTRVTLAMRLASGGWSIASTPNPGAASSSELSSVGCWSSSDCLAVGTYSDGSVNLPMSLRLAGGAWSNRPVELPWGASEGELAAVSCPYYYGFAGCTGAGWQRHGGSRPTNLLSVSDGHYWGEAYQEPGRDSTLDEVSCVADDACMGTGDLSDDHSPNSTWGWRLNGEYWSLLPNPSNNARLRAISCSARDQCTALSPGGPLRWDGWGYWWSHSMPAGSGTLSEVSCASSTSCMAVGYTSSGGQPSQNAPYALGWNGTRWVNLSAPNPGGTAYLIDVSCTSWNVCVALGQQTVGAETRLFALHWNGDSWSLEPIPSPPGSAYVLPRVLSCSIATHCLAAGIHRASPTSGNYQPLAVLWDGTSWTLQPSPPMTLWDIACPSPSLCVGLGPSAGATWNGSSWSVEPLPTESGVQYQSLNSLSCASTQYCLAVGSAYDGSRYLPLALARRDDPPPPVEEPALVLHEPSVVNRTGATLHWSRWRGTGFGGYELHRGSEAGFAPSAATLLARIDNVDITRYRDDSAAPGSTVFYKLVSGGETWNERRATLPAENEPARAVLQPDPARGQAATISTRWSYPYDCDNTKLGINGNFPERRALLRWDLSDIPANGVVRSARLLLYRSTHTRYSATTFTVRSISREWRESPTYDCHRDGVTWNHAHPGVSWGTPGGDAGPVLTTETVPSERPPGWHGWDVTTLVQEWIAGQSANHGVLVTADQSGGVFESDDSTSPALRPKLEIVFDDPEPVRRPTVTLLAPGDGARVRETVAVQATAGDDRRVERVEFLLDGEELAEDSAPPYVMSWDTRAAANGDHVLRARAVDDVGNVGLSDPITVEVANFDPPEVTLTDPPAGYAAAVKLDGPAGYWRLGETSGTVAEDGSGNARTGTYAGAFALDQPGLIADDPSGSARLGSGSGSVTLSNLSGELGSQFTVEAWIEHPGLAVNGTESRVVSRDPGAAGGWKLGVRRTGTGAQEAFFSLGAASAPVSIAPSQTSPPVYHLVGVYDGTAIRLYLDGRQAAQSNATGAANTSAAPVIGGGTAADLNVDEVALYASALSDEQVRAHFEVGRGRPFWVAGENELRATASAAAGRTLREVEFLVDDQLVGRDDTAPYSIAWRTAAAGAPVPDGPHVVTARAVDDHERATTSHAVTVNVANAAPGKQAELTAGSELPETLLHQPGAPPVEVDVRIKNTGDAAITGGATVLRYRWIRPNGSFDDSVSGNYELSESIVPGAEQIVRVAVRPPSLPAGLARSVFTLQFDLRDTGGAQTWWAERGNPPLEHAVVVQRPGGIGLGLERYYQYDGEALGGGMSQLVNLASGNNIVRFSPFASPGRGLSTVVDVTYNAHSGETKGSALGDGWLLSVSSISPFGEPLRCGVGTDAELKPDKCEEYALKDQQDLPDLALELTDADGTVHRFKGRRTGGRTFWRAPQGVHLYLHQLEADEQPECDIVEPGMAYQPDIQPQIRALWAFTRPDGTTFYYQRNGWPTGVRDRNGNCLDLELTAPPSKPDRVRVSAVVDAAGVADPALRPRRTFALDYYDDEPHPLGGKTDFPKVKSIRDHSGSTLTFHYYKDDRPLRITQQGGTTTDGLAAADRSWVFTYADWDIDEVETVPNLPDPAARVNPDPTITDNSYLLYSVRDPRGHETKFTYHGEKPQEQKDNAGKLKHRVDRAGATTTYNYNLATDTTTVDLPEERQSRYAFDAAGSMLRMIDKVSATREETTHVSWTADRHVSKLTEPGGAFTEFEYNQNGLLTKRWDQLRRLTQLEYEHIRVDDDDQPSGWVDQTRTIPHISQLTKRITPRGKAWEFDHDDETGNLLELEDPEGFASRYEYDDTGNLILSRDGLASDGSEIPDEPDRTTEYSGYDANGLPTLVTDALGNQTRFCSDDDGLLRWVQDARHASSPLPPDGSRCFEHEGRRFRSYFDYDPFHRLARTSEPRSTEHDFGRLLWTHARFDANDNVVEDFGAQESDEFRPGMGARTALTFDAMDRPTRETLFDFDTRPDGDTLRSIEREETTEVEYDAAGRVERLTTPRGVATGVEDDFSTSYVYDLLDRPLVVTRHGVGGEERPSWFCYDAAGDLRSVTRPRGIPEPATCGPEGAEGDPGPRFTWRYEYTPAHELRRVIMPSGRITTYAYDPDGNLAETVNPEGEKLKRTYDGRDLPVEMVEDFEPDRPVTTRFAYDAVGNLRHLYSPRAVEAAGGSPTPESDFVHTTEYDALDRPIRELLPRQGAEDRRYLHRRFDAVGNLTHLTVPVLEDDFETLLGTPEQARECSTEEARKWVTCYTHFDPGWIKTSDDINGKVLFDYDPEGRQTLRTAVETGETSTRSYYRDGLLEKFHDEGGHLLLRSYDPNGNLSFASDDGVSSTRKPVTLELDHNGFDEVASTTMREAGQPTKVTEYGYWLDGLVRRRADDRALEGSTVVREPRRHEFEYDEDGRIETHLDFGREAGEGDDRQITHGYSLAGRETERVVYRAGQADPWQTTEREYFDNGLIRELRTYGGAAPGSPLRESHTVRYRDGGGVYVNGHATSDLFFRKSPNPAAPCQAACTQRWVYDGADRLVEEDDGHSKRTRYKLTPAGGIKKKFNAADEEDVFFEADFDGTRMAAYTTFPNLPNPQDRRRVLHYEDGNLACITRSGGTRDDCQRNGNEPSPLLVEDFSYDYRDRLEVWEQLEENRRTVYEHDALDRPIRETEVSEHGTTIHTLSYVGATRVLADERETGARQKTRSYTHDAYGRPVAMSYRADGGQTHDLAYAFDQRDNVSMLLDEQGVPKAAYGYTGYGEPDEALTDEVLPDTGNAPAEVEQINPFRYSSKRADALSGTIDMGARQFGPDIGQFLQADQFDDALADLALASDPLTSNRYALAAGNPISYIEVDGHMPCFHSDDCGGNAPKVNRLAANAQRASAQRSSGSSGGAGGTGASTPAHDGSSPPYAFYPAGTTPPKAVEGTRLLPDTFSAVPCLHLAGQCSTGASGPNVQEYERGNFFDYVGGAVRGYTGFDIGGNEDAEVFQLAELGGSVTFVGPGGARNAARGAWRTFAGREAAEEGGDAARRTITALTREQDTALNAVMRDSNRLEHIFGQGGKHNLGRLTQELGGQQAVVREAILRVPRTQAEGVFKLSDQIGPHPVTITGRIMNGVPRISNIWVPR
jgi:RHS repeat-associated protein